MRVNRKIHLYNRFGFGLTGAELKSLDHVSFSEKLRKEKQTLLSTPANVLAGQKPKDLSKAERKRLRTLNALRLNDLKLEWIHEMTTSTNIIHEKMSLFWHHHFACEIRAAHHAAQFSNRIRKNALGNFRTLVKDIAQSAAMMIYLNTRRSNKAQPNEDFARELCELFLLGRDNGYTENDVQEIARCFTGWRFDAAGNFYLKKHQHDFGQKTILGKTETFGGLDVIDLLLEQKACARFIAQNLYSYFVNPDPQNEHIESIANVLYESDYEIVPTLKFMADSDWFYHQEHVLSKIKSPLELLIGIARQVDLKSDNKKSWNWILRSLDQELYKPPNVKGWKENRAWINSNSLTMRLRLPAMLLSGGKIELPAKPDYDSDPNEGMGSSKLTKKISFTYNWEAFLARNKDVDLQLLFFNMQCSKQAQAFLTNRTFDTKKEALVQLMSLPEYQLI